MEEDDFTRLVSLACHDLRTPLATIYGFARTLNRLEGEHDERTARFLGMIEAASEQMTGLLDDLGAAARIQGGRWEPARREANTLELAQTDDARIAVEGEGGTVQTDVETVERALRSLATAALRHGPAERVTWLVHGRELELSPVTSAAGPVLTGEQKRDLGSLVARAVIEALGGSLQLAGESLLVTI